MKTKKHFKCSHHRGFCRRNLSACTKEVCQIFGDCGHCRHYFIPAGQEPCRSCRHNKIKTEA